MFFKCPKSGKDFHVMNEASGGNLYKWHGMFSTINKPEVTPFTVLSFCKKKWEVLQAIRTTAQQLSDMLCSTLKIRNRFQGLRVQEWRCLLHWRCRFQCRSYRWKCVMQRHASRMPSHQKIRVANRSELYWAWRDCRLKVSNAVMNSFLSGTKSAKPRHFVFT